MIPLTQLRYLARFFLYGGHVGCLLRRCMGWPVWRYHHVERNWKRPKASMSTHHRRSRQAQWRREPVFQRITKPTRIDAARRMGYKAKQGVVMIHARVRRGGLRKGKIHADESRQGRYSEDYDGKVHAAYCRGTACLVAILILRF